MAHDIFMKTANSLEDYDLAKSLFLAYSEQLGFDLTFQNFSSEIESIHIQYGPPDGILRIASTGSESAIGCFGIRKIEERICELKRMYVLPDHRGKGFGQVLMDDAVSEGKRLGYERMRLDTIPTMKAAVKLYQKNGFYTIQPYRYNPFESAMFFEKQL